VDYLARKGEAAGDGDEDWLRNSDVIVCLLLGDEAFPPGPPGVSPFPVSDGAKRANDGLTPRQTEPWDVRAGRQWCGRWWLGTILRFCLRLSSLTVITCYVTGAPGQSQALHLAAKRRLGERRPNAWLCTRADLDRGCDGEGAGLR
jgi:hypothetical protein